MDLRNNLNSLKNKTFAIAHTQAKKFYNLRTDEQIKFICLSIIIL